MRVIPGIAADTHAAMPRAGRLEVRAAAAGAAALIAPDRAQSTAPPGRHPRARRLADPRHRAVRRGRWRAVAALGEFAVYDLGGGLGVRYTYAEQPRRRRVRRRAGRRRPPASARATREIIIEPGRAGRAAGDHALPRGHGEARRATFVAVDGGMGDNLEVSLYGQRFEATIADRLEAPDGAVTSSAATASPATGSSPASSSPARRSATWSPCPVTGAYCFTMANNYNGALRPPVVFCATARPAGRAPRDVRRPRPAGRARVALRYSLRPRPDSSVGRALPW